MGSVFFFFSFQFENIDKRIIVREKSSKKKRQFLMCEIVKWFQIVPNNDMIKKQFSRFRLFFFFQIETRLVNIYLMS